MRATLLSPVSSVALGAFILLTTGTARAQLFVEKIQRDYQVRYHLITGGYLEWPKCTSGETPAPHFPKNGFYGDLSEDPDKGVTVVSNLVQYFYSDEVIYTAFVKITSGESDLDGATDIANFASSDFSIISAADVNTNNYMPILQSVASNMAKLTLIKVSATQVIGTTDTKETSGSGYDEVIDGHDFEPTCANVEDCTLSVHASANWGESHTSYDDPTSVTTAECIDNSTTAAHTYANVGVIFESTTRPSHGPPPEPDVYIRNTRGRIAANLANYTSGQAHIYLKLTAVSCDHDYLYSVQNDSDYCSTHFAQTNSAPTSDGENKFRLWAQGALTPGSATSTTSNYITGSETLPTIMGSCEADTADIYGWEVADAVVIVAPDFTTVAELGECCACTTSHCPPGEPTPWLQSIHVNIPLGSDNFGGSAGALALAADFPSPALATPAALGYTMAANVEFITNSSAPLTQLQFKTSQNLANIQTNDAFKYTMSFYTSADAGTKDGSGFYQPTGSPYTTVVIENPDASTNTYNHLKITTTTDGNATVTDFIYSTNNVWEMDTGNGLRKETRASVWDAGQTNRTETVTIKDAADNIIYKELNFWRLFPWGQERLTNIVDPDGAGLTNVWCFYSNATNNGASYRLLQQQTDANGHWTIYQYDEFGRETNRVTQFLSQTNTAAASNRLTVTIYSTNAPQITTIESLLGTEISRRYQIVTSGEVDDIQCQTRAAAINASDNLTNITKKYTSGSFAGQLKSVRSPNGTAQIYLYSTNASLKTTALLSGVPDPGSDTNILSGTITTTYTMLGGQVLSNIVIYRQSGASDTLIDRDLYTYTDARNRSFYVVHLDGTTNQYNFGCCALDNEVDRDGTLTQYYYDALKRQTATLRNNITTTNVLDPNGAVLATVRIGTNGSQIPQQYQLFDLAGRAAFETNALGGVTVYTNFFDSSHQPIKKTTFPDLGTRFETNAQDAAVLTVSGAATQPMSYLYGVDSDGAFTTERRLDASGGTNEWTKTSADMVGRAYKTVFAGASGNPISISYYNGIGQLTNTVDPDGISTLLGYNEKGEQTLSVLDSNRNYTIDFSGADRITLVTNDITSDHGATVRRSQTFVWTTSADSRTLLATTETSVDGLQSWNTIWNNGSPITSHSQTLYDPADGLRIVTNTAPDGSYTVTSNQFGRVISVASFGSLGSQLYATAYAYDSHGRQSQISDARNGATTLYFNNADETSSTVSPVPAAGQSAQVTTNFFDNMGRVTATKLPDNTYVTNSFDLAGRLTNTFGSRTYPVSYTYDTQGRTKTMKTWQNLAGGSGAATTTWNYDGYRGWLTNKTYDGNVAGPSYTYTAAGRLASRLWARGTNTTHSYNDAGDLSGASYNDGTTPTLSYGYDRRGRQVAITNGSSVCSLILDDAGDLLSEAYTGGQLNGVVVTNSYDVYLRRTTSLVNSNVTITQFTYDSASRLQTVSNLNTIVAYSYLANSRLVGQTFFTNRSALRMTTTRQYDLLNRLTNISSSSLPFSSSLSYAYNSANQRIRRTDGDSSYWAYQYDDLGQVTSGKKYWSDATSIAGQQFEYAFDDIGNRQSTKAGGDQWGASLRYSSYSANSLNQYTSRTVPSYVNDLGSANSNATVTLWSADGSFAPTYRRGDYFRAELPINNSTGALWLTLTNLAVLQNGTNADLLTNDVRNAFIPETPEAFTYDADGNLTSDGRWTNRWDAENRLISMESLTNTPSASKRRLTFVYDHLGRRISKSVQTWNGSTWTLTLSNRFIYDGWNPVVKLGASNNVSPLGIYAWGLDLSGSEQGAGGVGGLIIYQSGSGELQRCFPVFDGNGNVSALLDRTGTNVAIYGYGPFGEILQATEQASAVGNPFLFSTKFCDRESGLLYYGYRYYSPSTGRWLSRDPMGERGGRNIFAFNNNDAEDGIDTDGRGTFSIVTGGGNAPPGTVSIPAVHDSSTGDNSSAYQLGWQWLSGDSARSRTFSGHDRVAEQMRSSPEAEDARKRLREALKGGCREGMSQPFFRSLGNEPKGEFYAGFWLDFFGRNPTRAFLGSFSGDATVVKCFGCCSVVKFTIHDPAGWQSATRFPPPYGYDPNRSALFQDPLTAIHFGTHLLGDAATGHINREDVPKSIFPDNVFGKYGQNIEVNIGWEEFICPTNSVVK